MLMILSRQTKEQKGGHKTVMQYNGSKMQASGILYGRVGAGLRDVVEIRE